MFGFVGSHRRSSSRLCGWGSHVVRLDGTWFYCEGSAWDSNSLLFTSFGGICNRRHRWIWHSTGFAFYAKIHCNDYLRNFSWALGKSRAARVSTVFASNFPDTSHGPHGDSHRFPSSFHMISYNLEWFQMFREHPRWFQMSAGDSRWSLLISDGIRWSRIIPWEPRWAQMTPGDPRGSEMIPDALRWFQTISGVPRWPRMSLDDSRWAHTVHSDSRNFTTTQLISNDPRWSRMIPNKTIWAFMIQDESRWC